MLERLAADGLLAVSGPCDLGRAEPAEQRRVTELLSGVSPDAGFVWFQYGLVVRMLKASTNADLAARRLPGLGAREQLGGDAWSHLRTAAPSVRATRVEGGWSLTGCQPWCTGWGLPDVLLVGALVEGDGPSGGGSDQVVFGLVPARTSPALHSADKLRPASMAGTSTHALRVADLRLPDDVVVLLADREPWAQADRGPNCNLQPSTPGIALAAVAALDLLAERPRGGRRPAGAGARRARPGVRAARRGRPCRAAGAARGRAAARPGVLHRAARRLRRSGHGS